MVFALNLYQPRGETLALNETLDRPIRDQVTALVDQLELRAKSLIVTIYGDAILPHGGSVWLGSLIGLVEPLGLSERVVRTAVFRLSKDDWLVSEQIGRRSYYTLSENGRRRFETAHKRIYAPPHKSWDGAWTLVISGFGGLEQDRRDQLRRELIWQGFGQISPGVFAHPTADESALDDLLREQGVANNVVVMRAEASQPKQREAVQGMVQSCWDVDELAANYLGFLHHFRPIWRALQSDKAPNPELCFLIRTLLIHDYRRVLLRDPMLPAELLPANWPGAAARLLCRNLYRVVQSPAERHIMASLETAEGPLPAAVPGFRSRFGGLDLDTPATEEAELVRSS
jgi:phenylacetic acid degradation operon negative regulatory protein